VPALPGVEPTRRQPEEPQEGLQRNACASLIDGTYDPSLVGTIGESLAGQREAGEAQQDQREPEQRREFLDGLLEFEDLVSEVQLGRVRDVQTDHHGWRHAEPPSRRRPRNAGISRDGQVPSVLHEFAQSVVVALLRAGRGHDSDHRPSNRHRSTPRRVL
jgi:hypothetical protein